MFGTAKRTLYTVFTFDQKSRGPWDKRVFHSKEGAILVDRLVAEMKAENNNKVFKLTSIFYRNSFSGATLMDSTLPNHQHDEWDRTPLSRKSEVKEGVDHSFLKPH